MINGKTILAIIPARGGSKGIPRKNIKLLAGKPLIAWTIEEAKKSKYIDRLILSSEDEEIINVAKEWGCEVPFIRPKELASDETPGIEPVIHAITTLTKKYDYVCLLQPTSPLRKVEDIDKCIEEFLKYSSDSCVSLVEVNKHPNWMYSIKDNQEIVSFLDNSLVKRRQELQRLYSLNGAIYISKTNKIISDKSFISKSTYGFIMSKINSIDIDDEFDFRLCDILIKKMNV